MNNLLATAAIAGSLAVAAVLVAEPDAAQSQADCYANLLGVPSAPVSVTNSKMVVQGEIVPGRTTLWSSGRIQVEVNASRPLDVVAHEMKHVHQIHNNLPLSELDAWTWAENNYHRCQP